MPGNSRDGKRKRSISARPNRVWRTRSIIPQYLVRRLAYWTIVTGVWVTILFTGLIAYYAYDLPDPDAIKMEFRSPGITFLASDGTVLGNSGPVHAVPVALNQLPVALPHAVLATEDRRFYEHGGADLLGIARAAIRNVLAGRVVQGGSTITQQLAKNLFLTPEKSFRRKFRELLLAFWLEHKFTKDQLLTIYLIRVYLGAGVYGVEAAALRYFGKTARQLSLAESAMIAGLLKAPSRYAPTGDLLLAQSRASQVLDAMVSAGWLESEAAAEGKRFPAKPIGSYSGQGSARYFVDWVLQRIPDHIGVPQRDLVVKTTLDPFFQHLADQVVSESSKRSMAASAKQAAFVALGTDGSVRAMIGGRDYRKSQFNRATQAMRQPGSAFKLFVYLAGLKEGFTPSQQFDDTAIEIDGWSPSNYDGQYRGKVSLRHAFAYSINTVAVQLAEQVGRDRVIAMARRLGLSGRIRSSPSLALGTDETTLFELTTAYASIAAGGRVLWPFGIVEIRDRTGELIYTRTTSSAGRVIEPYVATVMNDLLKAVVTEGTGKKAALPAAAGKTGTSQDFRDAWFIGYRGNITVGIWMGNDDASPMNGVTGGGLPAELWRSFMIKVQP